MPQPLRPLVLVLAAALAACATPSSPPPSSASTQASAPNSAEQMVAAIREAAGDGDGELAVQPLRDGRVEDLRAQAAGAEAARDYAAAAASLDAALEIVADDPELLQERAEVHLLQGETEAAGRLAERAYALGSQVGPLCRRHWATLEQLRLGQGDAAGAAQARAQVDGCRVGAPDRF